MLTNVYFVLTLLVELLFPSIGEALWAPFLVDTFYRKNKINALIWALAAGILPELLSPHTPFGLFSLVYVMSTFLLYDKKQYFFIDHLTTLPLMTFFFSAISTLLLALLVQLPLSLSWAASDLIFRPFLIGIISFLLYTLPQWFFSPKRRAGKEYFL